MAKATSAPMCKLCRTAHWSQQPHDQAGLKAMKKGSSPKAEPEKKRAGR
jgi:hypothetical protein